MKFPLVIEAFAAMDKCQWRIGDALLKEIPVGREGVHTDAIEKLKRCQEELVKHGYSVSPETLRMYRKVAFAFPAGRRLTAVSFSAHQEARTPEMLENIIKVTKSKPASGDRKSPNSIRQVRELIEQQQARKYHEESGEPRKILPKGKPEAIPLSEREVAGLRLLAEVARHVSRLEDADASIDDAIIFVKENISKLDQEDTEAFTDLAFAIAKNGHKLADAAQKLVDRKRKHLAAVGG